MTRTAVVARAPAGTTNPNLRETRIPEVRCTAPYQMSAQDIERAGLGDVSEVEHCFCLPPATAEERAYLAADYRFISGGVDYRIRKAIGWPEIEPAYYELILDRDA
jgi:hypothetical protein